MLWEVCNMCNMEGEHLQTRPVEQLQQAVSFLSSLPFPPQQRETKGVFPKETGFENSQVFPAIFCCWNSKVKSCHGLPCFIKTATIPHCFVVGHIHRFCGAILGNFFLWERDCFTFVSFVFVGEVSQEGTVSVDFHDFGWFLLGLCLYVWLIRSSDFFIRQSCREGSSEQLRLALVFTCYLFCCYSFPFPSTWKVEDHPG